MDYGKILSRALEITWKHKSLWLFGFLSVMFGGGGGRPNFSYNLNSTDIERFTRGHPELIKVPKTTGAWPEIGPLLFLLLIPLVILLALVAIVVSNLAQAALIGMVTEVEDGNETSVRNGFRIGWSRWLVLFGISLVVGLAGLFYVLITGGISFLPAIMAFIGKSETLGIVLLIVGFLFFLILLLPFIPVGIIVQLAFRQAVAGKGGVFASLGHGYHLFRANLGRTMLFWLVMVVVGMVVGFVFAVIFIFLLAPLVLSAFLTVWLAVVLAIPVFIITLFLGGLVQVFTSTAWTLAWRELQGAAAGPAAAQMSAGFPAS